MAMQDQDPPIGMGEPFVERDGRSVARSDLPFRTAFPRW